MASFGEPGLKNGVESSDRRRCEENGNVDNTMPRKVLGGWTPLEVYTGQPIALIA
ncbi:MAG: hypothetical protein QS721_04230 [Candidatus Endonucleobacter sp. (ex Gigantidas childressi)]|nr:hypothetical protein [Candidatus Endonucleobacter sp. (ex Gigantidas childressi)]